MRRIGPVSRAQSPIDPDPTGHPGKRVPRRAAQPRYRSREGNPAQRGDRRVGHQEGRFGDPRSYRALETPVGARGGDQGAPARSRAPATPQSLREPRQSPRPMTSACPAIQSWTACFGPPTWAAQTWERTTWRLLSHQVSMSTSKLQRAAGLRDQDSARRVLRRNLDRHGSRDVGASSHLQLATSPLRVRAAWRRGLSPRRGGRRDHRFASSCKPPGSRKAAFRIANLASFWCPYMR
jgi:hypothetical protein